MSTDQALVEREPYFSALTIDEALGFCFDDRFSAEGLYLSVPGGEAFFVNVLAIARELKHPGSASDIIFDTKLITSELQELGINFGIHSDDSHDNGESIDLNSENDEIGCAYISKRRAVMKLISQNGSMILKQVDEYMPEVVDGEEMLDAAKQIVDINWTLASNTGFFNASPRQYAKASIDTGAPSMLMHGKHDPRSVTIFNERPNTTFDTARAFKDGLPAYSFDIWAYREIVGRLPSLKDFDPRVLDLIAVIDTLGTIDLLGSNEVYARH
jgi:hypothetical protein